MCQAREIPSPISFLLKISNSKMASEEIGKKKRGEYEVSDGFLVDFFLNFILNLPKV